VKPIRDEHGIAVDFAVEGSFPRYGNDDDRVDSIAIEINQYFMDALRRHAHLQERRSLLCPLLTITSQRRVTAKRPVPLPMDAKRANLSLPGANPAMNGADKMGPLASLNSVAKLPTAASTRTGFPTPLPSSPAPLAKNMEER